MVATVPHADELLPLRVPVKTQPGSSLTGHFLTWSGANSLIFSDIHIFFTADLFYAIL